MTSDPHEEALRLTHLYPHSTPCRYWPGAREGEGKLGTIRSDYFVIPLGSSNANSLCVFVSGQPGYMLASHVDPLPR